MFGACGSFALVCIPMIPAKFSTTTASSLAADVLLHKPAPSIIAWPKEATKRVNMSESVLSLCVNDLTFSVVVNQKVKHILRKISFNLSPGDMCAILGPSGAGKSTLLDLVAGRLVDGAWSGTLDYKCGPEKASSIAYVYQSDLLISTLTVEETIRYSTWLNLGSSTSSLAKEQRVESIISQLALTKVRHQRVFDDQKQSGLSGGERKRLSIAAQIVSDPKFILLDEPTSGLDSALSTEVMTAVRRFCTKERLVLTTIHQPARCVFALFDKVLVLVQGRVVFFGPATDVVTHFTSPTVGFTFAGGYANPAEFILDVCRAQLLPNGSSIRLHAPELSALYEGSRYYKSTMSAIQAEMNGTKAAPAGSIGATTTPTAPGSPPPLPLPLASPSQSPYARSSLSQCLVLIHRTWTYKTRDAPDLRSQLAKNLSVGLLYGLLFFQKGDPSGPYFEDGYQTAVTQSVNSLLMQVPVFGAFAGLSAVQYLSTSNALYRREAGSKSYSPFAYAVSQAVALLPIQLFMTLLLVVLTFFLGGLPCTPTYFFFYLLTCFSAVYLAFALALAVTACCQNIGIVYFLIPAQANITLSLTGFSPKLDDMSPFYRGLTNLNYLRWQFEGLMINHWQREDTDDGTGNDQDGNGNVLEEFSYDNFSKFYCLWIVLLLTAATLLVFYMGVQPPQSRLHKVVDAEDSGDVLKTTSAPRTPAARLLSALMPSSPPAAAEAKAPTPAPSTLASLKEKLIVPDEAQLQEAKEEGPSAVDEKPKLSVVSFAQSNSPGDLSEGCCLVFRNVCAPAAVGPNHHGDVDDDKDNASDTDESGGNILADLGAGTDASEKTDKSASSQQVPPRSPSAPVTTMFVRGVSGVVHPGEMMAIMGSSGAGKTSLLNVLAQRKKADDFSGKIFYNGVLGVMPPFGFVTQEDVHVDVMTVREALEFAGELRLPESMPKEEKRRRVERILAILLLQHIAGSIVGPEHAHNISGGELKRLSIGVELLHFPGLMFLDEPTTGLDSSTSLEVLSALRNLANQQRTVVMTIHQPSQDMFVLFDRVMIMAQARVVYFGGVRNCTDFYTRSPYQFAHPDSMDPAEYMIAAAGCFLPTADGRTVTAGELAAYYASSPQCVAVRETIRALEKAYAAANSSGASSLTGDSTSTATPNAPTTGEKNSGGAARQPHLSLLYQIRVLLGRRFLILSRKRSLYTWKAINDITLAIILGSIWWQIPTGTEERCIFDRIAVMHRSVVYITVRNMDPTSIFQDRRFHYRERALNAYSPLAHWLATWIPQIPVQVFFGALFACVVYPMTGLRPGLGYFLTFLCFGVVADVGGYFLFSTVAALCPTQASALQFMPLLQIILATADGYPIYLPDMPGYLKVATYGMLTRYLLQAQVLNELQDNHDLPEHHSYLVTLGFTGLSVGECFGMMVLITAVGMVSFFLALKYMDFERR